MEMAQYLDKGLHNNLVVVVFVPYKSPLTSLNICLLIIFIHFNGKLSLKDYTFFAKSKLRIVY